MMHPFKLVFVDDEFLQRSRSGAIWGSVYFEIEDRFFPDSGWTDLVAGFLTAWLDTLTRVAMGKVTQQRVWFMDGPFAIDVTANKHDLLSMTFLHKEVQKYLVDANVKDLLRNGIDVGKQVIACCKKKGWTDKGVSDLSEAIIRGIEVLQA